MNRVIKIKGLSNILRRCLTKIGTGKNSSYYNIICFIADRQGLVSMKDIYSEFCMQKPSLSILVNETIKAGLVRKINDEHDTRSKKVELTAKGEILAREVAPSLLSIEDMIKQNIDQKDLEIFDKVLEQMINNGEENWFK